MAVTGTLLADFSSFYAAVQKADIELKGMETGAERVEKSLNRMADSLSGRKMIQDATLMAKAIEEIGGASALTEKELAKVGAQANEAIEKLKRLGKDVPPELQKIADAAANIPPQVEKTTVSMQSILGVAGKVASALGLAFSVDTLVNFGKAAFAMAGQVNDLSEKLGLSTDAVQGFGYAAEQGGSSLETVDKAIVKMNTSLAEGDKSTVKALQAAGLELSELRNMKPEDAFLAMTDAIATIESPMEQARVAMELFGKSGAELLPAIQAGFRDTAGAADKMSADTIKALADAEDAWASLYRKVTIVSGELIASAMNTTDQMIGSWDNFSQFMKNVATQGAIRATQIIRENAEAARASAAAAREEAAAKPIVPPPPVGPTDAELAARAAKAAAAAKKAAADRQKALEDFYDWVAKKDKAVEQVNWEVWESIHEHNKEVGERGIRILELTTDATVKYGLAWAGFLPQIAGVPDAIMKASQTGIKAIPPVIEAAKFGIQDLTAAFGTLAGSTSGTFSKMMSSFGGISGSIDTAKTAFGTMKTAMSAKSPLEGIAGMASGIAGIVSAAMMAINAVKALWSAFNNREGRNLVKDFAESFGGFDELHLKLNELGAAGEELWIKLTQGVAANNPAHAQRVIDEVTAALARQEQQHADTANATEEEAQATIETATQAAKALEELAPKLAENEQAWKAWGDVVTAQIQTIADRLRELTLPGNIAGPAMAPAAAGSYQTDVYLDGDRIASATAKKMPSTLRVMGL